MNTLLTPRSIEQNGRLVMNRSLLGVVLYG
jgi:hypothetical protein